MPTTAAADDFSHYASPSFGFVDDFGDGDFYDANEDANYGSLFSDDDD